MAVYRKRNFTNIGIHKFGGMRLKAYTIIAKERSETNLEPVLKYAQTSLGESIIPWLKNRNLGYLIYHAGEDADWLLTRVWNEGDIATGLVAADYGYGWAPLNPPCVECVWEAVITQFERDAWVRHMMVKTPNEEAYLGDQLEAGFY